MLHVVRYTRSNLGNLIEQINASGYGLTLGVHTRIDETIAQVTGSAHVGNLYVNRNMVGAVVGVQPFGGEGLSGTGPKAGGPLYLYRLLANRPENALSITTAREDADYPVDAQLKAALIQPLDALTEWAADRPALQTLCQQFAELAQAGTNVCCGLPASATHGRCYLAIAFCVLPITNRTHWFRSPPWLPWAVSSCGRMMLSTAIWQNVCLPLFPGASSLPKRII